MIERRFHRGPGYKPFLIREGWQVAPLNYLPERRAGEVRKVERHVATDEVEAEVREAIETAAPGGGYILASNHSLHDGIPVENIRRMFHVGAAYGRVVDLVACQFLICGYNLFSLIRASAVVNRQSTPFCRPLRC